MNGNDTKMTCESVQILLSEYLAHELEPGLHDMVSDHVAKCNNCKIALKQLDQVQSLLRLAPAQLYDKPAGNEASIEKILAEIRPKQSKKENLKGWGHRHSSSLYIALAAAAVAVVSFWFIYSGQNKKDDDFRESISQEVAVLHVVPLTFEQEMLDDMSDDDLGSVATALDKDIEDLKSKLLGDTEIMELYQSLFFGIDLEQG